MASPYDRNTFAPAPGDVGPTETSQQGTHPEPGDPLFSDYEAALALGRAHPKAGRVDVHPAFNREATPMASADDEDEVRAFNRHREKQRRPYRAPPKDDSTS